MESVELRTNLHAVYALCRSKGIGHVHIARFLSRHARGGNGVSVLVELLLLRLVARHLAVVVVLDAAHGIHLGLDQVQAGVELLFLLHHRGGDVPVRRARPPQVVADAARDAQRGELRVVLSGLGHGLLDPAVVAAHRAAPRSQLLGVGGRRVDRGLRALRGGRGGLVGWKRRPVVGGEGRDLTPGGSVAGGSVLTELGRGPGGRGQWHRCARCGRERDDGVGAVGDVADGGHHDAGVGRGLVVEGERGEGRGRCEQGRVGVRVARVLMVKNVFYLHGVKGAKTQK